MKTFFLLIIGILKTFTFVCAQNVGVNTTGDSPDNSAILDISSKEKGILIPRLTTAERDLIHTPAHSLLIFNSSTDCFESFNFFSSTWKSIGCIWNCGENIIDSRDSSIYSTIQIGNQCWMKENLKYLPFVVDENTGGNSIPYYYVYGYNGTSVSIAKSQTNYTAYGVLYNWEAAMAGSNSSNANPSGVQGVCPDGWHLPSDAEWAQLEIFLGMNAGVVTNTGWRGTDQGTKLKSTFGWNSNGNGSNTSGFTSLPGGARRTDGFRSIGSNSYFWSSSVDGNALNRNLLYNQNSVFRDSYSKGNAFSVRCVRN